MTQGADTHLQGLEQLLDRGYDLLLPAPAAHHREALCNCLLRALASILLAMHQLTSATACGGGSFPAQLCMLPAAAVALAQC